MSKTLAQTNPHLQDSDKRRMAIIHSVATSSAVEGIYLNPKELDKLSQALINFSKRSS